MNKVLTDVNGVLAQLAERITAVEVELKETREKLTAPATTTRAKKN